jgi:hypothetical protein
MKSNLKSRMKSNRIATALTFALMLSASSSAFAAATPEEAARLKAVLETYMSNAPGLVAVSPEGDAYKVRLDFKPIFAKAKDVTSDITPLDFTLKPLETGKWQFDTSAPFSLSFSSGPALTFDIKVANLMQTGVFNEAMSTFETSTMELTGLELKEALNDPASGAIDIVYAIKKWTAASTATMAADNSVTVVSKSTLDDLVESVKAQQPASVTMPTDFTLSAENTVMDTTITGLKGKTMNELLAFFVAHPEKDLIIKDQAALKTMLKAALPLFNNMNSKTLSKNLIITTAIGPVTVATVSSTLDLNGVVKDGKFGQSIGLTGLALPPGIVPPFAADLVPQNLTIDYAVSGFDLATITDMALAELDLSKDPPLPADFEAKVPGAMMPGGTLAFTINPSSLESKAASVAMNGVVNYNGSPIPSGSGLVSLTGFDEILKAVSAAPPEMGLQSAIAGLLFVKGLGKAEDGGKLSWKLESTPEGSVLVNGLDPMKMAPAQ